MKERFTIIVAVAALLVGALLGYYIPQLGAKAPESEANEEQADEKRPARARSQSTHEADLNRLRARIAKLEQENSTLRQDLAQRSDVAEEPVEQPATNRVERHRRFGPPSFAELEEMRKNDPERYVQTTNRIAQFRAGWQGRLQNQFDILESADTAHMTKDQFLKMTSIPFTEVLTDLFLYAVIHTDNTDQKSCNCSKCRHGPELSLRRDLRGGRLLLGG